MWPEGGRLGLAVSGGGDSLALLLLAHAACPGAVAAATVDHGLRAESGAEARAVAQICARLGVPHAILRVSVPPGNVQAAARQERYRALGAWAAEARLDALATAHQADDQAETLLMRLNRGSGVAGLAGVRARGVVEGVPVPVIRPVLGWRRAELAQLVAAAGLMAVDDPSNADDRFDRVRMRKALADVGWLNHPGLSASAANLADADAALDWAAEREWREQVEWRQGSALYRPAAPRAVALRVLARIIAALGDGPPRGQALARMYQALHAGRAATLSGVAARPLREGWRFRKAPPRRGLTSAR